MKSIILTIGLQGSGKSTWAKEQVRKYPGQYKRVNKDSLRAMLDNSLFTFENEKFTLDIRDKIVEKSLRDGYNVIVDDTNFPTGGKHFLRMCEIARLVGDVQVVEKYFDVSLKEALHRNKTRPSSEFVPEDIIHSSYQKHIANKNFKLHDEYFPPLQPVYSEDSELPEAIISDIDGTVAIHTDRSPYDMSRVDEDFPNFPVIKSIIALFEKGYQIIFVSGRDGSGREKTEKWLNENFDVPGFSYKLFMRNIGDNRKDSIIKEEIYNAEIKDKYNVLTVFDDRLAVVELWRRLGLSCFQVAPGDF